MQLNNSLTTLLNIKYPILSAPMAGISGGKLAKAVSQAGGFGFIGVGYDNASWLEQQLRLADNTAIGVGFITWRLAEQPELLELALREKIAAIMLTFGDPAPFIDPIKNSGSKLICQVQTVKDAKKAAAYGADIIVAQGTEAGGHGATRGTFALVPAIVDAVTPVPVIAAGGIADGRGLAAALMLGAQAVLLGTRFYVCTEALGSPESKQRIINASGDETIRSHIFDYARGLKWPGPFTARSLTNQFTEQWQQEVDLAHKIGPQEQAAYRNAVEKEDFSIAGIFAGEEIDLIHEITPADKIIRKIIAEAQQVITNLQ